MDSYELKTNNVVDALNDVHAELAGESAGKKADTVLEALNNIAAELKLESAPYSNTANAVRDIGLKLGEAGGGSESGFVATFTTTLPAEDGTITDITCDKTYEEVMEAVQGEGASFRLIDNLGRVTPSCGYYIDNSTYDEEKLVIVVNIFGIPNNAFGTMDVAGLNILYGGNSLTAEYAKAWIGLQGG